MSENGKKFNGYKFKQVAVKYRFRHITVNELPSLNEKDAVHIYVGKQRLQTAVISQVQLYSHDFLSTGNRGRETRNNK